MADIILDPTNKNSKELLGQGVKAYILQDYNSAVAALSRASELLAEEHGDDQHESLGEVYLYYGKALLALSRDESDALGDAVPKNDDEDGDDDEEVENVENVDNEKAEEAGGSVEKAEETAEEANETAEEVNETVEDEGTEEKNDDEPTDLQVAWEVLELAKKIFEKKGEDGKKQLAETLVILGEISLESENFEQAVNDMKTGVEMQKQLFGDDSRSIAESLYKLGIAYSTTTQIDEAIEAFKESLQYLNNRIKGLEKSEDKKDSVDEEIEEIKALVPEIEEKVADMKNFKEEAIKNLASALCDPKPTGGASSSSSAQASDISHLVKRKRKSDEHSVQKDVENGAAPPKKPSPGK